MLTYNHGISRTRNSIMISAKLCAKVPDLVNNLKLDSEKEKMMTECSVENIQKYLLLNHNIIDILKCSAEIVEFNIEDGANVMKLDGSIAERNKISS